MGLGKLMNFGVSECVWLCWWDRCIWHLNPPNCTSDPRYPSSLPPPISNHTHQYLHTTYLPITLSPLPLPPPRPPPLPLLPLSPSLSILLRLPKGREGEREKEDTTKQEAKASERYFQERTPIRKTFPPLTLGLDSFSDS